MPIEPSIFFLFVLRYEKLFKITLYSFLDLLIMISDEDIYLNLILLLVLRRLNKYLLPLKTFIIYYFISILEKKTWTDKNFVKRLLLLFYIWWIIKRMLNEAKIDLFDLILTFLFLNQLKNFDINKQSFMCVCFMLNLLCYIQHYISEW